MIQTTMIDTSAPYIPCSRCDGEGCLACSYVGTEKQFQINEAKLIKAERLQRMYVVGVAERNARLEGGYDG